MPWPASPPAASSPAVAKSALALQILYHAVNDGRTVVYDSFKNGLGVFKDGKVYGKAPGVEVRELAELSDPNTVHISDGIPITRIGRAFPLAFTTPKKENWHKFSNTAGILKLVIPAFARTEMMELRDLAFSDVKDCDEPAVEGRFGKWGGNVRNVLTLAEEDAQQTLETALGTLSLEVLQDVLVSTASMEGAASDKLIHRLIDIVPKGTLPGAVLSPSSRAFFAFHHAQLPTEYVEGKVADALLERNTAQFLHFLHVTASDPSIAGFRGKLYEHSIVFPRFQRGVSAAGIGKLPLQRLSPSPSLPLPTLLDGASTLDLSQGVPLLRFRTAKELQAMWGKHQRAVFVPPRNNFPGVDFVLRLDGVALLGNATVSEKHDIKIGNPDFRKLLKAVGLLAQDEPDVDDQDAKDTKAGTASSAGTTGGAAAGGGAAASTAISATAAAGSGAVSDGATQPKGTTSAGQSSAGAGASASASADGTPAASDSGPLIPFLWVLPQESFDRFNAPGPLLGKGGKALGGDVRMNHRVGRRVAQFKLLLKVPDASTVASNPLAAPAIAATSVSVAAGPAPQPGLQGASNGGAPVGTT